MPLPITIDDLSTTAALNYPSGADAPSVLDDTNRAHAAFIAQLRDKHTTLAGSGGSALVGFIQSGTGAIGRTSQAKQRERLSVTDFYANGVSGVAVDPTGTVDSTLGIQAAIDAAAILGAEVFFPDGTYKLTAPLNITAPVRFLGVGAFPYVGALQTRGRGSWLYFAHTGIGCYVATAGLTVMSGVAFEKIGTFRDQPTPAPAWAPTAHDFDFSINNADVTFNDVMLLNPTKGIKLRNGGYGRIRINGLRGQPMQIGLDIDECYDLPQIVNLQFWPYWKDDSDVHDYTMANLDAILLSRVDNPQLTNIFTIFARSGLRIAQSAAGTVSKLSLVNADFDRGVYGLWVDSTVTGVTSSKIANLSVQGEVGATGSKSIFIEGDNVKLQIENISSNISEQNAIRVEGTGNFLSIGNAEILNYNQSGSGFPAVEALAGNTVQFAQAPVISGGGAGPKYSTTGTIYSDDNWIAYTPTITTGSGTITTLGTLDFKYKRRGNLIDVSIDIPITTNGTGAGDVRFTLPATSTYYATGAGREAAIGGAALVINATPGGALGIIYAYNNTYPGGTGTRIVGSLSYGV